MPCYGVIRIKDHYYTVTDLVEDYKHNPFQKADFSSEYLSEPNLNPEPQHTEDHSKDDDSHVMTSRNVYEYISFINFGNMQTIPNIPD